MRASWPLAGFLLILPFNLLRGQSTVELFSGSAWNLPTTLSIHQAGEPDLRFTARYSTRPGEDTPYFGARVGFWRSDAAWVIEFVHHKLYLENPPPEVKWFKITYGLNLLTVGRAWRRGALGYSLGAGAVVTHASNSVRGLSYTGTGGPFNKGYTFSGVTGQAGVQYRLAIGGKVFLLAGGLLSATYVEVKVRHGDAHVPNLAAHLNLGAGFSF